MILYPALDLRGGRCVRLLQGDFARETVFADDPVAQARAWVGAGAAWLHVVDLDASKGQGDNRTVIGRIARAVDVPVQAGGGMLDRAAVSAAFDLGVARVVLGTALIESPEFARAALGEWGDRIAVGVDARGGKVATRAWTETTAVDALTLVEELGRLGARHVVYTDIDRDGTLSQPNYDAYAALVALGTVGVIASGGIAALAQLHRLQALGCAGAILGRSIYTGAIDLAVAIAAVATDETERSRSPKGC